MSKLTDVTGIGPVAAKILSDHGIKTVETLAAISLAELLKIPGFGDIRARAVKKAATVCLRGRTSQKPTTITGNHSITGKKVENKKTATSKAVVQSKEEIVKEKKKNKKENKKEKKGKDKDKKKEKKGKSKSKKQKK